MKRKSFLMTIVALLFAGVAFGQGTIPWPSTLPADAASSKAADTIYFCLATDSLYPIELGYDVAGKRLHPSYGDWSLVSRTSSDITAVDYNLGVLNGNGGAGNAYKAVGSGKGGLLFQYKATDAQCGIAVGTKFYVYVFVLPDFTNVISKDTFICKTTTHSSITINLAYNFADYLDLYAKADVAVAWKHGGTALTKTIWTDSIATYTLADTLLVDLANSHPDYSCGLTGRFKFVVRVDSIGQLENLAYGICEQDTVGDQGKRDVNGTFFHRNFPGTYKSATVNGPTIAFEGTAGNSVWATHATKNIPYRVYEFKYTDCGSPATVRYTYDTLFIIKSVQDPPLNKLNWGSDTVKYCRTAGTLSIYDLYNDPDIDYPAIIYAKPALAIGNSYWYDRGVTGTGSGPNPTTAGTKSGANSLVGTQVNLDDLKSSTGYHYLWRPDAAAFPCLIGQTSHAMDSGYIVVILQDPAVAADYRAQMCLAYITANPFDLNAFTGLEGADWKYAGTAIGTAGVLLPADLGSLNQGTHKLTYDLAATCGAGGRGVFYLKITPTIKVPANKTVTYCVDKLPVSINLNELLGIVDANVAWTSAATGFNATTGILDVPTYQTSVGGGVSTVTFTATPGAGSCFTGTTTITLKVRTDVFVP